ncbi:MAG: GntR family transcriptional regulator [Armatimonadota bacterium]|nr:GntR family transcriptional regulator [Armatimonadota bacterium]
MESTKLTPFKHQTKTQALSSYLIELANKLGPEARLPTMQELCNSLGVSVVTLNRALSELEAQNIIQRKHGVGIFVSPRLNQKTIGLVYDHDIFGTTASPFGSLLVEEARDRAARGSEKFSVYFAMPSREGLPVHDDLVEAIRARRLSGILFVSEQHPQAIEWLLRQNVPLVALSYKPVAPWRVAIDHAAGVRLGVQALAEQGCRRIGLWIPLGVGIGRAEGEKSFPELDAFRQELKKHGLPFNLEWVWEHKNLTDTLPAHEAETKQEQGYRAANAVFGSAGPKQKDAPDGLVIMDDMMTRGALVAFQKLRLHPGSDIKIATHTNRGSAVLHGYESDLIFIEVDPAEIVQAMFSMLETLMEGRTPPEPTVSIRPKLR